MSQFIQQNQFSIQNHLDSRLAGFLGCFLKLWNRLVRNDILLEEPAPYAKQQLPLIPECNQLIELVHPRRECAVVVATQSRLIGKGSRKFSCFRCQT